MNDVNVALQQRLAAEQAELQRAKRPASSGRKRTDDSEGGGESPDAKRACTPGAAAAAAGGAPPLLSASNAGPGDEGLLRVAGRYAAQIDGAFEAGGNGARLLPLPPGLRSQLVDDFHFVTNDSKVLLLRFTVLGLCSSVGRGGGEFSLLGYSAGMYPE